MEIVVMVDRVTKFSSLLFGVVVGGFIFFTTSAYAAAYGSGLYSSGLYSGTDVVAPVLSNGGPSGVLEKGTKDASLTVTTDESSTCRYGTVAGTVYNSMTTTFVTSGGVNHTTPVTGLSNGSEYSYYVRCIDIYNNANTTDYVISFSISSKSGEVIGKVGPGTVVGVDPVISGCSSTTMFSPVTGQRCPSVVAPTIPSTSTGTTTPVFFATNLSLGMRIEDVKKLQQYLNTHGSIVASTGPGSLGSETTYFGPATKAAVIKFQSVNAIKPASGFFGPLTRAFVNNKEKGL